MRLMSLVEGVADNSVSAMRVLPRIKVGEMGKWEKGKQVISSSRRARAHVFLVQARAEKKATDAMRRKPRVHYSHVRYGRCHRADSTSDVRGTAHSN